MSKKIVAIGGGESGRIKSNGTRTPYETQNIDMEIVRLTGKENPNFLLLAHAQPIDAQKGYFDCIAPNYEKLGCECRFLPSDKLNDKQYVQELLDWADIIYEGGGDTMTMIKLWQDTGFDKMLRSAWEAGKVMCGLSAGANCWFKMCSTDSLKILYGDDKPLTSMECLGFVDGLFVPHCDEQGRIESTKDILRDLPDLVGLAMSNCAALVIVDGEYKIVVGDSSQRNLEPYGIRMLWHNGKYIQENIPVSEQWHPLAELYSIKE